MEISRKFQGFFFGVVCKEIKKLPPMKIKFMGEWSMINFRNVKSASIYQILKQLNKNYPLDKDGKKLSTKEMTSKQMTDHIQWIERVVSWNGHTFDYVTREWQRLIESTR